MNPLSQPHYNLLPKIDRFLLKKYPIAYSPLAPLSPEESLRIHRLLSRSIQWIHRDRPGGTPLILLLQSLLLQTSDDPNRRLLFHGSGCYSSLPMEYMQRVTTTITPSLLSTTTERPKDLDFKCLYRGNHSLRKVVLNWEKSMGRISESRHSSPLDRINEYVICRLLPKEGSELTLPIEITIYKQLQEHLHHDQVEIDITPLCSGKEAAVLQPYSPAGCALFFHRAAEIIHLTAEINSDGWIRTLQRMTKGARLIQSADWNLLTSSLINNLWHVRKSNSFIDDLLLTIDYRCVKSSLSLDDSLLLYFHVALYLLEKHSEEQLQEFCTKITQRPPLICPLENPLLHHLQQLFQRPSLFANHLSRLIHGALFHRHLYHTTKVQLRLYRLPHDYALRLCEGTASIWLPLHLRKRELPSEEELSLDWLFALPHKKGEPLPLPLHDDHFCSFLTTLRHHRGHKLCSLFAQQLTSPLSSRLVENILVALTLFNSLRKDQAFLLRPSLLLWLKEVTPLLSERIGQGGTQAVQAVSLLQEVSLDIDLTVIQRIIGLIDEQEPLYQGWMILQQRWWERKPLLLTLLYREAKEPTSLLLLHPLVYHPSLQELFRLALEKKGVELAKQLGSFYGDRLLTDPLNLDLRSLSWEDSCSLLLLLWRKSHFFVEKLHLLLQQVREERGIPEEEALSHIFAEIFSLPGTSTIQLRLLQEISEKTIDRPSLSLLQKLIERQPTMIIPLYRWLEPQGKTLPLLRAVVHSSKAKGREYSFLPWEELLSVSSTKEALIALHHLIARKSSSSLLHDYFLKNAPSPLPRPLVQQLLRLLIDQPQWIEALLPQIPPHSSLAILQEGLKEKIQHLSLSTLLMLAHRQAEEEWLLEIEQRLSVTTLQASQLSLFTAVIATLTAPWPTRFIQKVQLDDSDQKLKEELTKIDDLLMVPLLINQLGRCEDNIWMKLAVRCLRSESSFEKFYQGLLHKNRYCELRFLPTELLVGLLDRSWMVVALFSHLEEIIAQRNEERETLLLAFLQTAGRIKVSDRWVAPLYLLIEQERVEESWLHHEFDYWRTIDQPAFDSSSKRALRDCLRSCHQASFPPLLLPRNHPLILSVLPLSDGEIFGQYSDWLLELPSLAAVIDERIADQLRFIHEKMEEEESPLFNDWIDPWLRRLISYHPFLAMYGCEEALTAFYDLYIAMIAKNRSYVHYFDHPLTLLENTLSPIIDIFAPSTAHFFFHRLMVQRHCSELRLRSGPLLLVKSHLYLERVLHWTESGDRQDDRQCAAIFYYDFLLFENEIAIPTRIKLLERFFLSLYLDRALWLYKNTELITELYRSHYLPHLSKIDGKALTFAIISWLPQKELDLLAPRQLFAEEGFIRPFFQFLLSRPTISMYTVLFQFIEKIQNDPHLKNPFKKMVTKEIGKTIAIFMDHPDLFEERSDDNATFLILRAAKIAHRSQRYDLTDQLYAIYERHKRDHKSLLGKAFQHALSKNLAALTRK